MFLSNGGCVRVRYLGLIRMFEWCCSVGSVSGNGSERLGWLCYLMGFVCDFFDCCFWVRIVMLVGMDCMSGSIVCYLV